MHGFCFAVLCCGYTLTDIPISIRFTSLALWQSSDCPSASKATLMNMDKYFMWIHYERLRYHNKAKHNKTVCIFLGIYCTYSNDMWALNKSSVITRYVISELYPLCNLYQSYDQQSQIAEFMGSIWGSPGSGRPQMGPWWPHEPCYHGYHCVWWMW